MGVGDGRGGGVGGWVGGGVGWWWWCVCGVCVCGVCVCLCVCGGMRFSDALLQGGAGVYLACQRGCAGGREIDDDHGGGVGGRPGPVSEAYVGGGRC